MRHLIIILALFLGSCTISIFDLKGTTPIFTSSLQANYHNEVAGSKVGKSCVTNVLSIVASGDSSIESAKRNGNIKNITSVDTSYERMYIYLPFYQKGCTIVRGD